MINIASYRKRGKQKLWEYRIRYIDSSDDKRKEIVKSGFRTKLEAINEAEEIEQQLKRGFKYENTITLAEHFRKWIKVFKEPKVSKITLRKYYQTLRHIEQSMPSIPMKDITSTIYQEFLNTFAENHVRESTTRINTHIKQSTKVALADKIIMDDFTINAIVSGKKQSKSSDEKYLSLYDTKQLLNYLITHRNVNRPSNYLIITAFLTGMRFGELTGLTWQDIDSQSKTVSINKSFDYIYWSGFHKTKTDHSKRIIDIDDNLLRLLNELGNYQQKKCKELQIKNPFNQVFFGYIDGIPSNTGINKHLKHTLQHLDIKPLISIHGARHTFGSILLYQDVDIAVVSEILGHKDVTITNEVYRHVVKELREKNRQRLIDIQNGLTDF